MSKFTPSPQEVALVNQIFAQADTQKIGVVTGDAAVKIFGGTKLPPTILAEVWNLADEDNKGVLTRKDVAVAVRLLGHAQRGERITEAHIHQPGPPPTIEGLNAPISSQWTGTPSTKSPPPGPAAGLPPLTPADKAKFAKLFHGCGPTNGLLGGDKAREVFVKSKLPVDKLSQIWTLADTKNRGVLDLADFTIAMYLIQASMSGALPTIPATLPPYVYEQARPALDGVASHATGGSGSFSPTFSGFPGRPSSTLPPQAAGSSILQPQITGQRPAPPLPARAPAVSPFPLAQQSTGQQQQWDVTPQEKASSDQFFDNLDTQKRGYIEGDVAVPFMLLSKLPDNVLAQIWDLADLNNDGRLTRDGFAVAMHLIQAKLAGKEVPTTLPPSLIPPSHRSQQAPAQPPQPTLPEGIRDLLWDDTPPASATAPQPPQPAQSPAPAFPPPRASTTSPKPAPPPAPNYFGATDPFGGSSSPFVTQPPPAAAPAPTFHKDLLGDDDEPVAPSPPLQDKSAEIGNLQNQLHSTNRAVETSKHEREDVEKRVAEQAAQLAELQTQLATAKASYETEVKLLATLRERYSTQNAEIQKARQELIHAESDLSALRVEKSEVEGALLRDKEEVRELQRKMAEVGTEVETIKLQTEKIKKEAKQQKGLLAIAKKQLSTREAERAKVEKEMVEAQADAEATSKELEETEATLAKEPEHVASPERVASPSNESITAFAAAQPLPASPEPLLASPASAKSTNPFERLTMGAGSPRPQSPFLPFTASAALPTPPTGTAPPVQAAEPSASDPFGFEDAFGAEQAPAAVSEPQPAVEAAAQPSVGQESSPFDTMESVQMEDMLSPAETEHFVTPPSTATLQPAHTGSDKGPESATSPGVENQMPGHFGTAEPHPETKQEDTDLNAQLKELDIEESDSSDSEDDEPLADVKSKLQHEPVASTSKEPTPGPSSTSAFDDSLGISGSESTPAVVSPPTNAASASPFGVPSAADTPKASTSSPFAPSAAPQEIVTSTNSESSGAAGVSDFDEALGKLSGGSGTDASQFSNVSQFTFDSAFEDDFDFAAAKAASESESAHVAAPAAAPAAASPFPPPPSASTSAAQASTSPFPPAPSQAPKVDFDAVFLPSASGGAPSAAAAPAPASASKPFSFDDAFGGPSNGSAAPASAAPLQPATTGGSHGISFDDAFGGVSSEPSGLDNSFSSATHQLSSNSHPTSQSSTPFPASTPSSPTREASGSIGSRRSLSPPPRQMSPPPRQSSKSRPSTASSEKEKEKPTRHSKLSIRLPFGRKKAKHDPMPSNLSHSLLVEEPADGATPAAEDDIDAVKTLCSMGFSRTQAVTALEQHDYDVQRALNSLLGAR